MVILAAALVGCFVVAAFVGLLWPTEKEPIYNGKKLSEWLVLYVRAGGRPLMESFIILETGRAKESREAVLRIGTNALPCLLRWVPYREASWRRSLLRGAEKMPAFVRRSSIVRKLDPNCPERPDNLACIAFGLLGPDGAAAVPELTRLMNNLNDQDTSMKAMWCLAYVGDDAAWEALKAVSLNRSNQMTRIYAEHALIFIKGQRATGEIRKISE